jgi:hypothetical protein
VRATSAHGHRFHRGLVVRPICFHVACPDHPGHRADVGAVGRSPAGHTISAVGRAAAHAGSGDLRPQQHVPSSSSMGRTCHRGTMWRLLRDDKIRPEQRSSRHGSHTGTSAGVSPKRGEGCQPQHQQAVLGLRWSTDCARPCSWTPTTGSAGRPPRLFPVPGRARRRRTGLRRPPLRARATATFASRTPTSMWTRRRRQSGKSTVGRWRSAPPRTGSPPSREEPGRLRPSAASSRPMAPAGPGVPADRRGRTRCTPSAARRRPWRASADAAQLCRHPGRHAAQRRRRQRLHPQP